MADRSNDPALAGEYAMGLLEGAEKRVFEDRLTREPELRALYAAWVDDLTVLDPDGVQPPGALKDALDLHLFGPPETLWQKIRGYVVLGTAVAAMAMAGIFFWPASADYSATLMAQGLAMDAQVFADDRILQVSLDVSEAPDGKDYELWIIAANAAPVSLGVVADGSVKIPANIPLAGAVLAVTVEQLGGSPNGAPTTNPIVVAPLSAA